MYKIEDIKNKIICGNSLSELKKIPNETIDTVITSPPYWNLRDYGTAIWEGGDIKCNHKQAKEKSRYDYKMPDSAQCGTHKGMKKGTDNPKWKDVCPTCGAIKKDLQLGLEPTFQEYINKLCDIFDEIKRVLKKSGSVWVVIGDTYSGNKEGKTDNKVSDYLKNTTINLHKKKGSIPEKSLCQIPSRFAIEMTNRGWILRNLIIWKKNNAMPSSCTDRFTIDYEFVYFFVKNKKYYFQQQFEPYTLPMNRWGGIYTDGNCENSKYKGKFRANNNIENFNSPRARQLRSNYPESRR